MLTHNTLIHELCKNMRVEEAKEIFDQMKLQGVLRNLVTYNTLINGLCKSKRVDGATKLSYNISSQLQSNLRDKMQCKGLEGNWPRTERMEVAFGSLKVTEINFV